MPEIVEERTPVALTVKCRDLILVNHTKELDDLCRMALDAEGLDPKDGWRFDVAGCRLVRVDGA